MIAVSCAPVVAQDPAADAAALVRSAQERIVAGASDQVLAAAIEQLTRAAALHRAAGLRREEAAALGLVGDAHYHRGDLDASLVAMRSARGLLRDAGDKKGEAETVNQMRWHAQTFGDFQAMLDFAREALGLYKDIGDKAGVNTGLMGLANAYKALNEPAQSARTYDEADAIDTSPTRSTTALLFGADQYEKAGELATAARRFELAAAIAGRANRRTEETTSLGEAAAIRARLGEVAKARSQASSVAVFLNAADVSLGAGDRVTLLRLLGVIHGRLGDITSARAFLDRAVVVAPRNVPATVDRFRELAQAYGEFAWKAEGVACYDVAIAAVRDLLRNPVREARLRAFRAAFERDIGRLAEARADIEAALPVFESMRQSIAAPATRSQYFSVIERHYDLYVDILMRLDAANPAAGLAAEAFRATERARARGLLDLLAEASVDLRSGADPDLIDRERRLQRELERQVSRQQQASANGAARPAASAITSISRELDLVRGEVRARSPRYAALTRPEPLSLGAVQQLLDDDTLLLEYALGHGPVESGPIAELADSPQSYLWVVSRKSMARFTLEKREEIERLARQVFSDWSNPDPAGRGRASEAAHRLSRAVLGPAATLLGRRKLIVVAAGALQFVPFAALPDPSAQGQLLADRHEILVAPSASVLAQLGRADVPRLDSRKALAVFADPVFDRQDPRVEPSGGRATPGAADRPDSDATRAASDVGLSTTAMPRLPFTRDEAEAIATSAGKRGVFRALGFAADKPSVMGTALNNFRVVHFATHALLNSTNPDLSGLVLSLVDERGNTRDGFVRLNDIYNMRLDADLVVLSACQTALGRDVRGDGVVGLTRGFMYAGARRVMSGLWRLDDRATSVLMGHFYRNMFERQMRPAAALRAAQSELRRHPRWSHPYYWASFQLHGHPR